MFMKNLEETIGTNEFNRSITENGAVGYRTTGKNLLDLNFAATSLRKESEDNIIKRWKKAYYDDKGAALLWLFFASDVRGGLGERRLFKIIFTNIAMDEPELAKRLIPLIPEYNRFDNIFTIIGISDKLDDAIVEFVQNQLNEDMVNYKEKKPISLLAKWMPSINTHSKETVKLARFFVKKFGITDRKYRKMLSTLRAYLDVVEVKTSGNRWDEIDYNTVPSKANLKYKDAFLKHDEERRREFLNKLTKGDDPNVKINSSTLFPYELVHNYETDSYWNVHIKPEDPAIEAMWKALPDYVNGAGNTIVVQDDSGSMLDTVGNTSATALSVAQSLAIYFAERTTGEFHNKYITFSSRPQIISFTEGSSLHDKVAKCCAHSEVANTNIKAVFNLILRTAVDNYVHPNEMPKNILIISDMEFDGAAYSDTPFDSLFDIMAHKFKSYGYELPRLVFWNVCSRTNTIPVTMNKNGVALISGFNSSLFKMVISNKTDPYEALLEQLNSERYEPVKKVFMEYISNR